MFETSVEYQMEEIPSCGFFGSWVMEFFVAPTSEKKSSGEKSLKFSSQLSYVHDFSLSNLPLTVTTRKVNGKLMSIARKAEENVSERKREASRYSQRITMESYLKQKVQNQLILKALM